MIEWREDIAPLEWDARLASVGGHPLQSALWGDARRSVDGIEDARWTAAEGDMPLLMARVETRRVARVLRAAWIPKGPVVCRGRAADPGTLNALRARLRGRGFLLCVDDAYPAAGEQRQGGVPLRKTTRTAIVDLTGGLDAVLNALDKQWRYGVRSAARRGVTVDQTRDTADAGVFFALCERISAAKGFELPGSLPLLNALLAKPPSEAVEARLFCARLAGEVIAGAAVIRSGRTLHYFWGGVDRRFPKLRAGEAVQWAVMEWAIQNGIERYDLEGIDPAANPGTFAFKMKMGAHEVTLPGLRAYALTPLGRAALYAGRLTGKI